jgi:hypothetical protein
VSTMHSQGRKSVRMSGGRSLRFLLGLSVALVMLTWPVMARADGPKKHADSSVERATTQHAEKTSKREADKAESADTARDAGRPKVAVVEPRAPETEKSKQHLASSKEVVARSAAPAAGANPGIVKKPEVAAQPPTGPARTSTTEHVIAAAETGRPEVVSPDPSPMQVDEQMPEHDAAATLIDADATNPGPGAQAADEPVASLVHAQARLAATEQPTEVESESDAPSDAMAESEAEVAQTCSVADCVVAEDEGMQPAPVAESQLPGTGVVLGEPTVLSVARAVVEPSVGAPVASAADVVKTTVVRPAVLSLHVRDAGSKALAPASVPNEATAIALLGLVMIGWVVYRATRISDDFLQPLWVASSRYVLAQLGRDHEFGSRDWRAVGVGALLIFACVFGIPVWLPSMSDSSALAGSPTPDESVSQPSVSDLAVQDAAVVQSSLDVSVVSEPSEAEVGKIVTLRLHLSNLASTPLWGASIDAVGPWDTNDVLSSGSGTIVVEAPNGRTIQASSPIPVGESRDVSIVLVPRRPGDQQFRFIASGLDFLGRRVKLPSPRPQSPAG